MDERQRTIWMRWVRSAALAGAAAAVVGLLLLIVGLAEDLPNVWGAGAVLLPVAGGLLAFAGVGLWLVRMAHAGHSDESMTKKVLGVVGAFWVLYGPYLLFAGTGGEWGRWIGGVGFLLGVAGLVRAAGVLRLPRR
jgi:peptidoglycan biosynthesis protein MviN/MurJ (putative lipid II flippase)